MPKPTVALLNQRLTQLEKNSDKIDVKVDKMLTNHLPHIEAEIISMKTRINILTSVNIGAIIILAIINKFL